MAFSPWKLLQEELRSEPWKLLVACVLLNQTSHKQVRPVVWGLFAAYPTPERLAAADPGELARMLRPLGLQNRRSRALVRLARELAAGAWQDPRELHSIGKYAADSYAMFVEGDVAGVEPTDKKLLLYRAWALGTLDDAAEPD